MTDIQRRLEQARKELDALEALMVFRSPEVREQVHTACRALHAACRAIRQELEILEAVGD